MAEVSQHAFRFGWGPHRQEAFGTELAKGDMDKYESFLLPLQPKDRVIESFSNAGQVGTGHEWATAWGKLKQMTTLDIPVEPHGARFMGMLLCGVFNQQVSTGTSDGYTHKCEWVPLSTTAAADVSDGATPGNEGHAWITSLMMLEDTDEKILKDCAVTSLTFRGEGANRIETGASIISSGYGTDATSVTWPTEETLDWIYNSACSAFTIDTATITAAQLMSWELTINSPVDMNRAWPPVSTEAARHIPSAWPLLPHPDRNFTFNCKIRAQGDDYDTMRAALIGHSEHDIDFTFLGKIITTTLYYSLICTIPKGVLISMDESWESGYLNLDLSFGGNYDSTEAGPIAVSIINDEPEYMTDET